MRNPAPCAVTYATISIGSQTQLLNEQFQTQARIKMTHVPYRAALGYVQFHFTFRAVRVIGERGSFC